MLVATQLEKSTYGAEFRLELIELLLNFLSAEFTEFKSFNGS